jgi:hypothetical protein
MKLIKTENRLTVDLKCKSDISALNLKDVEHLMRFRVNWNPGDADRSKETVSNILSLADKHQNTAPFVSALSDLLAHGIDLQSQVILQKDISKNDGNTSHSNFLFKVRPLVTRFSESAANGFKHKLYTEICIGQQSKISNAYLRLRLFDKPAFIITYAEYTRSPTSSDMASDSVSGTKYISLKVTVDTKYTLREHTDMDKGDDPQKDVALPRRSTGMIAVFGFPLVAIFMGEWLGIIRDHISTWNVLRDFLVFGVMCGVADVALTRLYPWAAFGIILSTIGAFSTYFRWTVPVLRENLAFLGCGVLLIVYDFLPGLIAVPLILFSVYEFYMSVTLAQASGLWLHYGFDAFVSVATGIIGYYIGLKQRRINQRRQLP